MSRALYELTGSNLAFAEDLYARFMKDPASVPEDWRRYFEESNGHGGASSPVPEADRACGGLNVASPDRTPRCAVCGREEEMAALQYRVDKLIRNYRVRGHRIACVDPLGRPAPNLPELMPEYHGLTEAHMDRLFSAESISTSKMLPLREILRRLRETYARYIGVQFMHIDDLVIREWLQERMESTCNRIRLPREKQLRILTKLTDAVIIEEFIQTKFPGMKRFSLEGAETLIPLLDLAIDEAGGEGVNEIVIGMAHRGRLNVLANIMGKTPEMIFREFEDADAEKEPHRGDVKYHLGYHNDWPTSCGREVHLALCFNPSHLEYVNPVAMGRVRAKQDRLDDFFRTRSLLALIHGDASFSGEGIVQETLNLSELSGYTVGGTLHIIINNQIGFTTTPEEGRSGVYASDPAKMLQIPIFHVNGENPEAVAQVVMLAMDFRRTFKRDVVIDMYCYRRWGHNEGDEPTFTQPVMYRMIASLKSIGDSYLEHLLDLNEITREETDEIAARRRRELEQAWSAAHDPAKNKPQRPRPSVLGRVWRHFKGGKDADVAEADTGVEKARLVSLLEGLTRIPESFHPHPKIVRWLEQRRAMGRRERPLDWSAAEALAFASLSTEGVRVRLSGQDSCRGTFSHRHAVLYDYENGRTYVPLENLSEDQAPVTIINSPLSEVGVLGFEYGYSIAYPDALVMWEAQFGDFANCAQALIDQGIVSAEDKWRSLSGLVMLLPHGFEGMGPEHSSARLERFLMLAAGDNIQVVNPTTPAQFFHCLRRQAVRPWRKPLVVMTPKSLLRHPKVVSPLDAFAAGRFRRILPDDWPARRDVSRVLLCSGKVYYDLIEEREKRNRGDAAILRVEQLYPLQENIIEAALSSYSAEIPIYWVQEEPENMGAWPYLRLRFCDRLVGKWPLHCVARAVSSSPATGSARSHKREQRMLIEQAFA